MKRKGGKNSSIIWHKIRMKRPQEKRISTKLSYAKQARKQETQTKEKNRNVKLLPKSNGEALKEQQSSFYQQSHFVGKNHRSLLSCLRVRRTTHLGMLCKIKMPAPEPTRRSLLPNGPPGRSRLDSWAIIVDKLQAHFLTALSQYSSRAASQNVEKISEKRSPLSATPVWTNQWMTISWEFWKFAYVKKGRQAVVFEGA